MDKEITETILKQLGGRPFLALTGSKQPMAVENGLQLKLARNKSQCNMLTITLQVNDLYTMHFRSFRALQLSKGHVITDLYADQLQDVFEDVTGLYCTLAPR